MRDSLFVGSRKHDTIYFFVYKIDQNSFRLRFELFFKRAYPLNCIVSFIYFSDLRFLLPQSRIQILGFAVKDNDVLLKLGKVVSKLFSAKYLTIRNVDINNQL